MMIIPLSKINQNYLNFRLTSIDGTSALKTGIIDPDVHFVVKVLTDSGSTLLTVSNVSHSYLLQIMSV